MNYIAHIHLAKHTKTSLVGNFMGDFVKGTALEHFDSDVRKGILLHRKLDAYTDRHPLIISIKQRFPNSIRRYSGIALDVYFDHLLCLSFEKYSAQALKQLLDEFYLELARDEYHIDGRFLKVKQHLLQQRWLHHYLKKETVQRALLQIQTRFSRQVSFADACFEYLLTQEAELNSAFKDFYPHLMLYASQQCEV